MMRRITRGLSGITLLLIASRGALASSPLEQQLTQLFVGRSFTIRNFYRGAHLHYGSDGKLLEQADPGYWSRDGMVKFSAIKISKLSTLVMEGDRYCIQF